MVSGFRVRHPDRRESSQTDRLIDYSVLIGAGGRERRLVELETVDIVPWPAVAIQYSIKCQDLYRAQTIRDLGNALS